MFEKILVAVDNEPHTQGCLPATVAIAARNGASVLVTHVRRLGVREHDGNWDVETSREAHELVAGAVRDLRDAGINAQGEVRTVDSDRSVGREIAESASEHEAGLIVIGSRRRGDVKALFGGSVSHDVLRHAQGPVLVAPPVGGDAILRRILVAVDGSPAAHAALRLAGAIAVEQAADVIVSNVSRPAVVGMEYGGYVPSDFVAVGDAILEEARDTLRAMGVTKVTLAGARAVPVAEAIAETAAEMTADLIVIGSRGLGAAGSLLAGSVSHGVLHETTRPVLVTSAPRES